MVLTFSVSPRLRGEFWLLVVAQILPLRISASFAISAFMVLGFFLFRVDSRAFVAKWFWFYHGKARHALQCRLLPNPSKITVLSWRMIRSNLRGTYADRPGADSCVNAVSARKNTHSLSGESQVPLAAA